MLKFSFILFIFSSLFFIACTKDAATPDIVGEYEGTFTNYTINRRTYLSQTTNQITTDVTTHRDTLIGLLNFELGQEEDQIILTHINSHILSPPITLTKENQANSETYSFNESWRDGSAVFYPNQGELHFNMTIDPGSYGDVVINSSRTEKNFEGFIKK
jgi:hypothetical protein